MWLTPGQMQSARILVRRKVLTMMRRRKDGPACLCLTLEARLALGMLEPKQAA
jgi:hypothetical protein